MHFVQGRTAPFYIEAMQEVVAEGDKKTKAAKYAEKRVQIFGLSVDFVCLFKERFLVG